MLESASLPQSSTYKGIAAAIAAVALAGTLGGYAIHEHHIAQALAEKNQQATASLKQTQQELTDLTTKVSILVAREQTTEPAPAPQAAMKRKPLASQAHGRPAESRWQKMQSQLDAQNRAIAATQSQLASTEGDLASTRTELTGSIAHTHDELVLLEKRGQKNYTEFDIVRTKQFAHEGPFSVKLRKTNEKHQYADLDLIVDDRTLTQKHVNLFQPVMFSTPDSPQPVEMVINQIGKDHIHGYIAAPRFRQSELASMGNSASGAAQDPDGGTVQVTEPTLQTRPRQSVPQ